MYMIQLRSNKCRLLEYSVQQGLDKRVDQTQGEREQEPMSYAKQKGSPKTRRIEFATRVRLIYLGLGVGAREYE